MQESVRKWIHYAEENADSAKILFESGLFNPCLQNVQQCIEKALKALLLNKSIKFKKTHSIIELRNIIESEHINIELTEEECEFLDSIYLPSKYPIESVLPEYIPGPQICATALSLMHRVLSGVKKEINDA